METRELLIADSTLHTRMFYIMTLGTVKGFRHHGLATRLLQRVMEQVERDAQCGTLYLHVITCNVAAIRFYEKLGFYRVTEMKDYYRINDQNHNCFVYAKYYHGNQGRKDYYYLLTSLVSSIWRKVTSPFALATDTHSATSKNR
jgi:ribosomal protein S18 acetylase RimI-like enzyme